MKKKKYLPLYYEWMETGLMSSCGLCNSLKDKKLKLFSPDDGYCLNYWGYWGNIGDKVILYHQINEGEQDEMIFGFNQLRQNILLFLAAMNNEL